MVVSVWDLDRTKRRLASHWLGGGGGGGWSFHYCVVSLDKKHCSTSPLFTQVLVVQRPDNFIQWISHYPTVSICVKILVFPRVQANMHTLATAKFGSVRKPKTTFNVTNILDPE